MSTAGTIISVSQSSLGSTLSAGATAGDASIFVDDTSDFDGVAGGVLQLGDTQYEYDTVNDDTGEIHLLSTLGADADADDRVDAWDTVLGQVAIETRALVELPGTVDNDDSIDAIVAQSLAPLLPLGLRDPGAGEAVAMQLQGTDWLITDVRGRKPVTQAASGNFVPVGTEKFTVEDSVAFGDHFNAYVGQDGSDSVVWAAKMPGDAQVRWVLYADTGGGLYIGDGTIDIGDGANIWFDESAQLLRFSSGTPVRFIFDSVLYMDSDLLFNVGTSHLSHIGDPRESGTSSPAAVGVRQYPTTGPTGRPDTSGWTSPDAFMIFDSDLGKPIWWTLALGWVDASGASV